MSDTKDQITLFEFEERKTIRGYPELRWTGKRPYTSTQYYPAQHKETYGKPDDSGWLNKIFWGDNLQVMSHLLKDYRSKIKMIYIDPPFDSKANYKKRIKIKDREVQNDSNLFEEKQYGDIWTNDEYLQFMYERLIIMKELLSDDGFIWVQCDPSRGHYIKILMDEIFGNNNFVNHISWKRTFAHGDIGQGAKHLGRITDFILLYQKSSLSQLNAVFTPYEQAYIDKTFRYKDDDGRRWQSVSLTAPGGAMKGNPSYEFLGIVRFWQYSEQNMYKLLEEGKIHQSKPDTVPRKKMYLDEAKGIPLQDIWTDIVPVQGVSIENENYPTQKPEALIERIILASTNSNDLILDSFMGSGTTLAVALKTNRRYIGADINLGAIQTTSKRLNQLLKAENLIDKHAGFEVHNVNNYEFFRNPLEARDLLIEALNIQPFHQSKLFDGELDGRNVKIMPVNRITTKADLDVIISNLPYTTYDKKKEENPGSPVDYITLVCMGHEPDLTAAFKQEVSAYKIDVQIVDILTDKKDFEFKREAKAEVVIEGNELVIKSFYPMNLMQKLSLQKEQVDDYKQLVESVVIDWDYDGKVLKPEVVDIPEKNDFVKGRYDVPKNRGVIRVKITDLLSESLEIEVE
ncbi:MAG: site-specific DNA-methyltransferase [Bacilli bacterium]|nr:site-specific DNA-methyltransferase [Bacilli bacterium]